MYVLATNMWFSSLMRQFFFWIDKIVFNFISAIYNVLIAITRTSVFTQSDFAELSDRIYKLLAVFMVFKVTLSLITYVVNPDNFTEKSKGVYKLSTNIIISLAMLILTPYIFSYAYEVQTILLEDNSLGVLILGGDDNNANDSVFNTAGDKIAYTAMTPFFSPNVSLVSNCTTLLTGEAGNKVFNSKCSGITDGSTNEDGTLYGLTVDNEKYFSEQTLKTYVTGVEKGNLGLMFRQDMALATANDNTEFVMDYKFLFSTATGIIIILLLVTFCMDVGVRSIKLAFLQLIAPVPIISYIDPKKGKDGMFKKWGEMCFKTYLSLFIRLIALYFAVFIIEKISDGQLVDVVDGSYITNPIIYVFIIIGALMFAKQLPKILEGLGIKLDGDGKFSLNPLKKMEDNMIGGKKIRKGIKNTARGAAGMAIGGALGTVGALTGAGAMRGVAGAFGGMKSGLQGKKLGEIRKAQVEKNSKMRQAIVDGSRFSGRVDSGIRSYLGMGTKAVSDKNTIAEADAEIAKIEQRVEPLKRKQAVLKEIADTKSSALKRAEQKIVTENAKPMFTDLQNEIRAKQARVDSLKSKGASAEEIHEAEADLAQTTFKNQKIYVDRNLAAAEARKNGESTFTYISASGEQVTVDTNSSDFEIDAAITDIQENIEHLINKDEIQEINTDRLSDGYTNDETFKSVTSFKDIGNLSDMAADESRLLEVGEDHVSNVKASSTGNKRTAPRESVRNLNREKENLQQSKRDLQTSDVYKQHQADDSAIK